MSWRRAPVLIPATHPSAALHFPGRPVIPGALLLDVVAEHLAGAEGLAFRAVKFLAPVPHGVALELRWQAGPGGTRFEMCRDGAAVLTGRLEPA